MKKWDGLIYCVKCGARDATIKYRDELTGTDLKPTWHEYLDFTCAVCGHTWSEFPLDHLGGENE